MRKSSILLCCLAVVVLVGCQTGDTVNKSEIDVYDCAATDCKEVRYHIGGSNAPWHHSKQMVKRSDAYKVDKTKEAAFNCDHCSVVAVVETPVVDGPD